MQEVESIYNTTYMPQNVYINNLPNASMAHKSAMQKQSGVH